MKNECNECEAARTSLALSQKKFSRITGISVRSISRFETGERSPTKQHLALFKILSVLTDSAINDLLRD